jgi:hypothetical protein
MSMAKREIQPVDAASLVFNAGMCTLRGSLIWHQATKRRAGTIIGPWGGFCSPSHGHDDSGARLDHMFKKMVLGVAHLGRQMLETWVNWVVSLEAKSPILDSCPFTMSLQALVACSSQ